MAYLTKRGEEMDELNYQNLELYHYGVKGMKWGIRRRTPEEKAAARRVKGEKKQAKIVKKQDAVKSDNEYQKQTIRDGVQTRNKIKAEKLSNKAEKERLDRKIALDQHWTNWGKRRDQDKSFNLNARIKELEDYELRNESDIANAVRQLDINKRKLKDLDEKYERIGRRYFGDL